MGGIILVIVVAIVMVALLLPFLILRSGKRKAKKFTSEDSGTIFPVSKKDENHFLEKISGYEFEINGLNQTIDSLRKENIRLNKVFQHYKNNLSLLLKFRKDNSDLLFFYRELIHTIVYKNPLQICIVDFNTNLGFLNEDARRKERKEYVLEFEKWLFGIYFSELDKQLKELLISILYSPFRTMGETHLDPYTLKRGDDFCRKASKIIDSIVFENTDLKIIEELYQFLLDTYERWKRLLTTSRFQQVIAFGLVEMLAGIMAMNHEFSGSLLSDMNENRIDDNDEFIARYRFIIQSFVEKSASFTKKLDAEYAVIEMLYQEYQEKEMLFLYEKMQTLLASENKVSELYSTWRTRQANQVLKEHPDLKKEVIENLKAKDLNEESLRNIKSLLHC